MRWNILLPVYALATGTLHAQQPYRIPVVLHIIHDDGPENISDAQARNGIEILTRNWRKQNPDTVEIVPQFQPIAADMEVEFELARLDPEGNCTNGINRLRSPLTLTGTHNVKSLIHWPRHRYLNIYVVRNAAGLAGHALMPFQADSIPEKDGIVIQGSYMGNIGTSNDLRSVVLSHEVGHYFNLFHVWGGNNVPEFYYLPVGQQANCDVGDEVDDTPATIGWSVCNLNATSCDGQTDNVQNFMDYAYCARMFTAGQKERVHAALNSPVAERNNLWQAQNLADAGLLSPGGLCKADFRGRRNWCVDEDVELEDASYHDITDWTWNVGLPAAITVQQPVFSYGTAGVRDVTLTVGNSAGSLSASKPRYLRVLENTGLAGPWFEGFEIAGTLEGTGLFAECEQEPCYALETGTAATGLRCMRLPNTTPGLLQAITSPRLDVSGVPFPVLRFKYAFAQRDAGNTDKLVVKISRDCGKTWMVRRTYNPDQLPTVAGTVAGTFNPAPEDWAQTTNIAIPPSFATDNLLVRFEFTSGGGHDLFIDDINLDDITAIGIDELDPDNWTIVPNPAQEHFRLEGPLDQQDVEIYSTAGTLVLAHRNVPTGSLVSLTDLPTGLYLVRLTIPGFTTMRRLMVTR
jgi:PKD repeat protein